MIRHLAIELMQKYPPRDLRGQSKDDWLRAYVSGHQSKEDKHAGIDHTQFSYVPMQTINPHKDLADASVRRVMIIAPIGDDEWLNHLAERLDGRSSNRCPTPRSLLAHGSNESQTAESTASVTHTWDLPVPGPPLHPLSYLDTTTTSRKRRAS